MAGGGGGYSTLESEGPNGTVTSTFEEPLNLTSAYANHTISPSLLFDGVNYTYETSVGNFSFNAGEPYLMSAYDLEGRLMTNFSSFVLVANQSTDIGGSYVLSATNETFVSRYNVTSGGIYQGVMEVNSTFNSTMLPKLTAVFTPSANVTISDWYISWRVVTPVYYLGVSQSETIYFGNLPNPLRVDDPAMYAEVGALAVPQYWNSTLWVNWSDTGSGILSVGPVMISFTAYGMGLTIDFPTALGRVDPYLVATTTNSYGDNTAYSTQKKTFYWDKRYYAFFSDNTKGIPTIRYSVGQEITKTMVWNQPVTVMSECFDWSFDVDMRNGMVALAWLGCSPNLLIYYRKGDINQYGITWSKRVTVTNTGTGPHHPLSVVIGFDGFIWIAAPRKENGQFELQVYRSQEYQGLTFTKIGYQWQPSEQTSVMLVPLPGGYIRMIFAESDLTYISWITWDPNLSQWITCGGSPCYVYNAYLPWGSRVDKLAATWISAEDAIVLYVQNTGYLYSVVLHPTSHDPPVREDPDCCAAYPAIQTDLNGDKHLFWVRGSYIYYKRIDSAGRTDVRKPFKTSGTYRYLSSSPITLSQRTFILYSSPVSGGAQIYFASVPTRIGGSGAGTSPWNRPGMNPAGGDINQLSEHVSPSTGILYLTQTDISIPGRGLDLSIQRIYRTPDAFGGSTPWDYEDLGRPFYSLGSGWSLNFPWYTDKYLYLWDGQRYIIDWEDDRYENKEGEYFLIVRFYDTILMKNAMCLYTKSGTWYKFTLFQELTPPAWGLHSISDASGYSQISFNYQSNRLASIKDTMNRFASFDYTPVLGCRGYNDNPPKVCQVTYGGRTVMYRYNADQLTGVIDPVNRQFNFEYCRYESSCGGLINPWLVSRIIYPNGARAEYLYGSAKTGTDLYTYVVVTQKLKTVPGGSESIVRKKTYNYVIVNGAVVYNRVNHFSSETTLEGSSLYMMDGTVGSMTVMQMDSAGNRLNQQRSWFGPRGVVQQDAYMGAGDVDNNDIRYSTYADYDEYGNVVYSRDPMGQETFMSYANSDKRGAFFAPGRLSVITQGKVFYDYFRDRDISDWTIYRGTKSVDEGSFKVLPPSMKLYDAWVLHSIPTQSSGHVMNSLVKALETDRKHTIDLKSGMTSRAIVSLHSDGYIWCLGCSATGGDLQLQPYSAGTWYLITIEMLSGLSYYNVWINGVLVKSNAKALGSGIVDGVSYWEDMYATMWVNEVSVFKSRSITISGISSSYGTRIRVLGAMSGAKLIPAQPISSDTVTFELTPNRYPRLTIQVLDFEWSTTYSSQSYEFWGGSSFDFVEPQFISSFKKTSSGFLRKTGVWVEDSVPSDETWYYNDWRWKWVSGDSLAVSGTSYHQSRVYPGEHNHYFFDGTPFYVYAQVGEFNIQYVYLRSDAFPAEVKMQYQDGNGGWAHQAYWGLGLDRHIKDALQMGSIPPVVDRWIMLTVMQNDLQPPTLYWKGANYLLVGGDAKWDFTAKGDIYTGMVRVAGLPQGYSATMEDKKGNQWSAVENGGVAKIVVYSRVGVPNYEGDLYPNAFPFTARFHINPPGGAASVYSSPYFENVFGGDEFRFAGLSSSNFLDNSGLVYTVKDRLEGVYKLQKADTVQESYYLYDWRGDLLKTKVRGPSSWIESTRSYDGFGNVGSSTSLYDDTNTHTTTYEYAPTYNFAYATMIKDTVSGFGDLYTAFTFDRDTGVMTSVQPPKLYGTTSYEYDAIGRVTRIIHPYGTYITKEYMDSVEAWNNMIVTKNENYNGGTRKRQTWECYDNIGRLSEMARFSDSGPIGSPVCSGGSISSGAGEYSKETYQYNWQDQVIYYKSGEGKEYRRNYDFLGRVTKIINPDTVSWVTIAYDDANNKKRVAVRTDIQNWRTIDYFYDWGNRPTKVRESWSGCTEGYCETTYTYDYVGNLLTVTTPPDVRGATQTTEHEYDVLNRLTKTKYPDGTYPDGTYEDYSYFNSGKLKLKHDRAGSLTTYTYDELKRIDTVTHPGGSYLDYDYDANGNLWKLKQVGGAAAGYDLEYTYDDRDRMIWEKFWIAGNAYAVNYAYDKASNVLSLDPPGVSDTMYYAYDAFNRACAVSATAPPSPPPETNANCNPASFLAKASYHKDDLLDTITYGNTGTAVTTKYTYDTNARPLSIETKQGATTYLHLDYEDYDALGNPVRIKANGPKNTGGGSFTVYECYWYDSLGRVYDSKTASTTGCAYAATEYAWNLQYAYDALGNRVSAADGGTTTYYKYDTYSRLCRTKTGSAPTSCTETGSGINEYGYNANGWMTSRKIGGTSWTYTWGPESEGRLTGISKTGYSATYVQDGLGRRVKSVVAGTENRHVYSGLSVVYETNPQARYVFLNGLRLAKVPYSGSAEYYAYDHLGNVRVVISASGGRVNTLAYRPFGVCAYGCGSEPKYSYTGEYRESTPNLIYLYSRWYDPTIGRFISPDDRLGSLSVPQDQNRYAYVMNNPMKYTDPTGHFWFLIALFLFAVVAGAEVSAIGYMATCGSSCSMNGVYGALAGGGVAGAIGFFTAGLGIGMSLGAQLLIVTGGGILANVAAYAIQATVSGESITWEGVVVSAAMGAGLALFGWGIGKLAGRMLAKPPKGPIMETVPEAAMMGDDATRAARRTVVIGEDVTNRVKPFASKYGYEVMPDLPKGLSRAQKLAMNRAWINARMNEGYTIVDLGPAPNYASYPYMTGPYYAMEQAEIAGRGYPGWLPIWGVFD